MTTRPLIGAPAGQAASTAAAIEPPALPAPRTRVRPFGGGGRNGAIVAASGRACGHRRIEQRAQEGSRLERVRQACGDSPAAGRIRARPRTTPRLHRCSLRQERPRRPSIAGAATWPRIPLLPRARLPAPEGPALRHPVPPAGRDAGDRPVFVLYIAFNTARQSGRDLAHAREQIRLTAGLAGARLDEHLGDVSQLLHSLAATVPVAPADFERNDAMLRGLTPTFPGQPGRRLAVGARRREHRRVRGGTDIGAAERRRSSLLSRGDAP